MRNIKLKTSLIIDDDVYEYTRHVGEDGLEAIKKPWAESKFIFQRLSYSFFRFLEENGVVPER